MPGIFGIVGSSASKEISSAMQSASRQETWYETQLITLKNGFFGASGLAVPTLIQQARQGEHALFLYGELFPVGAYPQAAHWLLEGLLREGKGFLAGVEGRFQAVFWDASRETVTLFTDRFATRPIYWTQCENTLSFASEIRTLLQNPAIPKRWNRAALVDFFTWGHYFHTHTLVDSVELLPPGGFYTFSLRDGSFQKETYGTFQPEIVSPVSLDTIAETFHTAVQQQSADTENLGISLSGGLDARTLLGMLPVERLPKVTTVALGVPGSADHRLATELAHRAGTQHFNYELRTDFLQNYARHQEEMIQLTDGQYLSSSIVIPTLPFYQEKGIHTLLRGHAGELCHMSKAYAFSLSETDRASFSTANATENRHRLETWAWNHLQAYMLRGVEGDLFTDISRQECQEMARQSLRRALVQAGLETDRETAQTLWFLYLQQRIFREIPLSMRKFDAYVNVRLPILDTRLVSALLALPSEQKMGETIQYHLLKRYRKDFLQVRNVNTGTFMGAGIWRQNVASLRQRILAKLRFPGYQPYEKMGLWLRRELALRVSGILNSQRCLDRGIFHPDTIRQVQKAHLEGKNHTYLLLALMICELGMRHLEETPSDYQSSCIP